MTREIRNFKKYVPQNRRGKIKLGDWKWLWVGITLCKKTEWVQPVMTHAFICGNNPLWKRGNTLLQSL